MRNIIHLIQNKDKNKLNEQISISEENVIFFRQWLIHFLHYSNKEIQLNAFEGLFELYEYLFLKKNNRKSFSFIIEIIRNILINLHIDTIINLLINLSKQFKNLKIYILQFLNNITFNPQNTSKFTNYATFV